MNYIFQYNGPKPFEKIRFACDEKYLLGLWFPGQTHLSAIPDIESMVSGKSADTRPVAQEVCAWLDEYFAGKIPQFMPPMRLKGSDFQNLVWEALCKIPYGQVVTYKDIANEIAAKRGLKRMSAQAVGGAVGRNPISIIVPCHRVVGSNGSLTGYDGGLEYKIWLLEKEGMDMGRFTPSRPVADSPEKSPAIRRFPAPQEGFCR